VFENAGVGTTTSVRVSWDDSTEIVILRREVEARARFELPNMGSVEFLPRGIVAQWGFLVRGASVCDLLLTEQYVDSAVPKVDSN
jgi:hypothetical protein